jgi:hypothetical protein
MRGAKYLAYPPVASARDQECHPLHQEVVVIEGEMVVMDAC